MYTIFFLSAIPTKGNQHAKHFKEFSNYRRFVRLCLRVSHCFNPAVSRKLQIKVLEWLDAQGEDQAKKWFEDNWMHLRGKWTAGDAGYAGAWNNNALESTWKWFKSECCNTTRNSAFHLLFANSIQYFERQSRDFEKWMGDNGHANALPSEPIISAKLWNQMYAYESGVIAFMLSLNQEDECTMMRDLTSTVLKKKVENKVHMLDRILSCNDTGDSPILTFRRNGGLPTRYYPSLSPSTGPPPLTSSLPVISSPRRSAWDNC
jgi:hypothetical protein